MKINKNLLYQVLQVLFLRWKWNFIKQQQLIYKLYKLSHNVDNMRDALLYLYTCSILTKTSVKHPHENLRRQMRKRDFMRKFCICGSENEAPLQP